MDDTLYEIANEIFDEVVFDDGLLEAFNDAPGDFLNGQLVEIVGMMEAEARRAMEREAKSWNGIFRSMVTAYYNEHVQWACPDCSDVYLEEPVYLEGNLDDGWQCPKCGCHTSAPKEDACYFMPKI